MTNIKLSTEKTKSLGDPSTFHEREIGHYRWQMAVRISLGVDDDINIAWHLPWLHYFNLLRTRITRSSPHLGLAQESVASYISWQSSRVERLVISSAKVKVKKQVQVYIANVVLI